VILATVELRSGGFFGLLSSVLIFLQASFDVGASGFVRTLTKFDATTTKGMCGADGRASTREPVGNIAGVRIAVLAVASLKGGLIDALASAWNRSITGFGVRVARSRSAYYVDH